MDAIVHDYVWIPCPFDLRDRPITYSGNGRWREVRCTYERPDGSQYTREWVRGSDGRWRES
jgi:hypothetical protein